MEKLVVSKNAYEALKDFRKDNEKYPLRGLLQIDWYTHDAIRDEHFSSEEEHLVIRYLTGDLNVELAKETLTYIVHSGDTITLSTGEEIILDNTATIKGHSKE